ncbi:phosphoribosyltransferase [Cellulomonas flavigena DSM 20109]|uniref:Phosphoribosyltransferase n=1 Tax=Cellulomonas flavigena (strain ATCC 482 / DSM 20109 / BCRC 11376 / JCM 18109 / NBRC 3775 / NCIMB 8073 / NRS 134) TaxID=446466 RepID=D5UK94_CELFN|nr:phosphoribosyltransferase [Cellulomonas flavigena DSM 20109]
MWRSDPPVWPQPRAYYADCSAWWRDPDVIAGLGPALAALCEDGRPTVVLGTESHGFLLGSLVALHLGIGFAAVRKQPERASDDDIWLVRRTPPDYRDRNLELAVRRSVLRRGDRVLLVDEWAATGGQVLACRQLVEDAQAHWLGAAVVVDALESAADRRALGLRGLVHVRELRHR